MTFDEQLDKLLVHGIVISDREKAKDILNRVNYYRFTGYALQFRQDSSGSNYVEGTKFETVYHLYKVDEILRAIGVPDIYVGNKTKRKPIGKANGFPKYTGKQNENLAIISLAKKGILKKP